MEALRQFGYGSREELAEEIVELVGGVDRQPLFYAISGSHLYGFPDEDSDLDVRGFHVSNKDYNLLESPDEQVHLGQDAPGELDVVSYELRKFGKLLLKSNFNVVELIFNAPVIHNTAKANVNGLRMDAREYLPMDLPAHYRGMAKQNFYKYVDNPEKDSYTPNAKKYLYVLRGLLAARHVTERDDVDASIRSLAQQHPNAPDIVDALIDYKNRNGGQELPQDLMEVSHLLAEEMIDRDEDLVETEYEREDWKWCIDRWMEGVRYGW